MNELCTYNSCVVFSQVFKFVNLIRKLDNSTTSSSVYFMKNNKYIKTSLSLNHF